MKRIAIPWQDRCGRWHRFPQKHHRADARRTAHTRAHSTGQRHRLLDGQGQLRNPLEL